MKINYKKRIRAAFILALSVCFLWLMLFAPLSHYYFGNPLPTGDGGIPNTDCVALNGEVFKLNEGFRTELVIPRPESLKVTKAILYPSDYYTIKTEHEAEEKTHFHIRLPLIDNFKRISGEPPELKSITVSTEKESDITFLLVREPNKDESEVVHEIHVTFK